MRWLRIFIAPNHFLAVGYFCWWRAHRTVRWRTGQTLFTVWCAPCQHARWGLELVDRWSRCPIVAPDSPMTPDFAALTSARHCSYLQATVGAQGVIAPLTHRTVRCTPDNLVNYSGASPLNSREWLVRLCTGMSGAYRTLSDVPLGSTLSCLAPNLIVSPTEFLSWFVLNLMHLR